ncbi:MULTISPECIES: threonine ammonia-lyase [Aliarcobacter]|jgi:threonine dehydratase|uniref:Threonine ammonia-lyase n=1 Tax=Aliarcobacter skirrowii CCUG 10374 TaxID=1032239 RepID=A0AAD0WMS1_9BACT|nr:threonine ammonia-lyase [Aliarcobacter skirrowii]AXX84132.1 threonine deaminase [Aliarcobacter skirrowii CCUG 10374]KAB0621681.1 threonine ammonia-lyase [Aliarcobacter skirrowii CCUG 10374]MDD2507789.1 threonine ammonia-lyase [Aliarcobacter skirrowii]MDD3025461.1 threonine ammonia-lyase [Aliarcobacter skirrowii]MDD3496141.1 threonine ammonia-lyase [Aliarcobacter skirrowii]
MITLNDIKDAKKRLENTISKTPLMKAPILSKEKNAQIYLKEDNLQITGSFKLRGAFNKVAMLDSAKREAGVVAASAGNHAQGLAFAAQYFGCVATIFMPEATPLTKVIGVKSYGANVVLTGENFDEAYASAIKFAKDNNKEFVHPFADDEVIAGQGTIALEILESIENIDQIIVPIGGGGLISGIAIAAKSINPNIKITGVVASGAKGMKESFEARMPIDSSSVRTIADGIAVRDVTPKLLDIILEYVDEIIEVSDNETANAILFLLEKHKLMVEGAGAVSVAAIMHDKVDIAGKKVCAVVSGGNIDVTMLSLIIEKGLIKSHRKMNLIVTLMDKPGALMKLTELFTKCSANIVQIDFDRNSLKLEFGEAHVTIALETKGKEHQEQISEKLKQEGFRFKQI